MVLINMEKDPVQKYQS